MRTYRRLMITIAALVAVLAATPAFAQQTQVNSGFGIGALGGLTFTSIKTETNDFEINTERGNGFMLGLWFGGNRDGRVGLMGEISYVTKKVTFVNPIGDGVDYSAKISYVEIPVLLRINAGSRAREGGNLYFLIGPVFDIQIKTDSDFSGLFTNPDDTYQGLDIGILGGVGFEIVRIGIEARYSWGIKSVLGTDAAEEAGFGKTKFNTLQILAKIRFN